MSHANHIRLVRLQHIRFAVDYHRVHPLAYSGSNFQKKFGAAESDPMNSNEKLNAPRNGGYGENRSIAGGNDARVGNDE